MPFLALQDPDLPLDHGEAINHAHRPSQRQSERFDDRETISRCTLAARVHAGDGETGASEIGPAVDSHAIAAIFVGVSRPRKHRQCEDRGTIGGFEYDRTTI